MSMPKRKDIRLKSYNYSSAGAYLLTVCTKKRIRYLWNDVGAPIGRPQNEVLSRYGMIVDTAINKITEKYTDISVDNYSIMPDHIHLLVQIHSIGGRPMAAPTTSTIINQMKGWVTKQIGFSIWQKSFHDHIIRNEHDYLEALKYIEHNPYKYIKDSDPIPFE